MHLVLSESREQVNVLHGGIWAVLHGVLPGLVRPRYVYVGCGNRYDNHPGKHDPPTGNVLRQR